jgi:hypothetical protein
MTLTWQKGVVDEEFMDNMATYFTRRLTIDVEKYLA